MAVVAAILIACAGLTLAAPDPPLRLLQLARDQIAAGEEPSEAREYLEHLPPAERLEAARAVAGDRDLQIAALGIDALIAGGHRDAAVPFLVARLVAGDDLTAFGYTWAYAADPTLAVRMYLKIARYVLDRFDAFPPAQRQRVAAFLIDRGHVEPLGEFSRAAVEQRLRTIEQRLIEQGEGRGR